MGLVGGFRCYNALTQLVFDCLFFVQEAVVVLLCANAKLEVEDHLGRSPLWIACHEGQLDVARKLLGAKASVTG